jgi:hypothetical protein
MGCSGFASIALKQANPDRTTTKTVLSRLGGSELRFWSFDCRTKFGATRLNLGKGACGLRRVASRAA